MRYDTTMNNNKLIQSEPAIMMSLATRTTKKIVLPTKEQLEREYWKKFALSSARTQEM